MILFFTAISSTEDNLNDRLHDSLDDTLSISYKNSFKSLGWTPSGLGDVLLFYIDPFYSYSTDKLV